MSKFWRKDLSNISPKAKIGDRTVVHSHVSIHDEVQVGTDCKIQAYTFIPNGVVIEDNVFIGPGVKFANDKYPKAQGEWELRETIVRKGASIGMGALIGPGVEIGENAQVGMGSVVTKNIPAGELWFGNPARFHKKIVI